MTLKKLGFLCCFTHWIKTLYNTPLASVITNGIISSPFQPRMPLITITIRLYLFIEPVAAEIRQNDKISGVLSNNTDHTISLYADNILIRNPKTSLAEKMKLINEYSILSDYSINWTNSTVLPLNMKPHDRSIRNIQN